MNIHQRLTKIKEEVAYIQKDKRVESYMAVTHDNVTASTREFFIKHGVLTVPHELESQVVPTGTATAKGIPFIRFEAKYRIDFINIDAPEEVVSVEYTAHALDHGDKAPGKAHSYAVKYAILKVLQIETGEEEEGRAEQKAEKPRSESSKSVGLVDYESLHPDRQAAITDLGMEIISSFNEDGEQTAYDYYCEARDSLHLAEEKTALRSRLPSNIRTAFTKIYNTRNKEQK